MNKPEKFPSRKEFEKKIRECQARNKARRIAENRRKERDYLAYKCRRVENSKKWMA